MIWKNKQTNKTENKKHEQLFTRINRLHVVSGKWKHTTIAIWYLLALHVTVMRSYLDVIIFASEWLVELFTQT